MLSKHPVRIVAGISALLAVPLLWSLSAEAKFVSCSITNSTSFGPGLFAQVGQTFSVECTGEGMTVRGRARLHSGGTGIQAALDGASGTTSAKATVIGYDINQNFIPNCINQDTTVGSFFQNLSCSPNVKFLQLSVDGSAP